MPKKGYYTFTMIKPWYIFVGVCPWRNMFIRQPSLFAYSLCLHIKLHISILWKKLWGGLSEPLHKSKVGLFFFFLKSIF